VSCPPFFFQKVSTYFRKIQQAIYILTLIIVTTNSFGRYRPIDVIKELNNANFVGEIIFVGYDSIKIREYSSGFHRILTDSITGKEYADTIYSDSVWNINVIHLKPIKSQKDTIFSFGIYRVYSWMYYVSRPDSLPKEFPSHGFWPRSGDTCLVVIDLNNKVSLFAMIENDKYIFWDPYVNSSMDSVFLFDPPFEHYPNDTENNIDSDYYLIVKRYGRTFACEYHCSINKKEFWNVVMHNSP